MYTYVISYVARSISRRAPSRLCVYPKNVPSTVIGVRVLSCPVLPAVCRCHTVRRVKESWSWRVWALA